ncbi:MPPV-235 hypothetical protein [Magpiepox virus 2]|nr:MPPV-235 hypothetical protein [Magpiepox virus 2]
MYRYAFHCITLLINKRNVRAYLVIISVFVKIRRITVFVSFYLFRIFISIVYRIRFIYFIPSERVRSCVYSPNACYVY